MYSVALSLEVSEEGVVVLLRHLAAAEVAEVQDGDEPVLGDGGTSASSVPVQLDRTRLVVAATATRAALIRGRVMGDSS